MGGSLVLITLLCLSGAALDFRCHMSWKTDGNYYDYSINLHLSVRQVFWLMCQPEWLPECHRLGTKIGIVLCSCLWVWSWLSCQEKNRYCYYHRCPPPHCLSSLSLWVLRSFNQEEMGPLQRNENEETWFLWDDQVIV